MTWQERRCSPGHHARRSDCRPATTAVGTLRRRVHQAATAKSPVLPSCFAWARPPCPKRSASSRRLACPRLRGQPVSVRDSTSVGAAVGFSLQCPPIFSFQSQTGLASSASCPLRLYWYWAWIVAPAPWAPSVSSLVGRCAEIWRFQKSCCEPCLDCFV